MSVALSLIVAGWLTLESGVGLVILAALAWLWRRG